ncbi:hypothetical protein F5Y09DRAFT_320747 [Xylaria sp. FL1042]|nr:hypothetical protein F5Y09DRAFT_320747 [Xylaria sp. FL1042]
MPTVTLRTCDGTTIMAEQNILIKSQYFENALTKEWLESETQEVDFIENSVATDRALKAYITYLQGGPIPDLNTNKYNNMPKYFKELDDLGKYFCDDMFRQAARNGRRTD